jgi:predicted  nucleic acid-binding Zn-ribbon protein
VADLKETLGALGRCEREIDELLRRKAQLPEAIAGVLSQAQQARDAVAERRRELAEAEKTRRAREAELLDLEARRQKFQGQTALVKTNDEYSALLREIEETTQRISRAEDEILGALDAVERVGSLLGTLEPEQRVIEQGHVRNADLLRGQLDEVEKALERSEHERELLAGRIPQPLLGRYNRVRSATGSGTTSLVGRSCSRCHRDVPYETINRVVAGEGHVCGNCGRLLLAPGTDVAGS